MKTIIITLTLLLGITKVHSYQGNREPRIIGTKKISFQHNLSQVDSFFRPGDIQVLNVEADIIEYWTGWGRQISYSGPIITLKIKDYHYNKFFIMKKRRGLTFKFLRDEGEYDIIQISPEERKYGLDFSIKFISDYRSTVPHIGNPQGYTGYSAMVNFKLDHYW